MSQHQDLVNIYNQINTNLVGLSAINRSIINRIINTHAAGPQLASLIDIYKQNMNQCTDYNIQINAILAGILKQTVGDDGGLNFMSAPAPAPAPVVVPAPAPAPQAPPQIGNVPINVTTTFYRRGSDGRDIPITAEEYARLSANAGAGRPQQQQQQPQQNPMAMLDLLMAAAREMANADDDEPAGATDAQIARETRTTQYREIENPCSTSCAITHEDFAPDSEVGVINHCGHIFMRNSLAEWLRRDSRCPMCRHDICAGHDVSPLQGGNTMLGDRRGATSRNGASGAAGTADATPQQTTNISSALISALGLNTGDNITVRHFTVPRRSRSDSG
jgi:hypothetical protein